MTQPHYSIRDLLRLMERLRDPETGCPWDIRQNFSTIVPSTLEECYELAEAIEQGNYAHMAEEIGDVLFQVIFYAQLGKEQHQFSFDSIVNGLTEKLIRRHPHVFANGELEGLVDEAVSLQEVSQSWERIKQGERDKRSQTGVLADVPLALPALSRAQKLQKRAAQVHFDWSGIDGVLDKVEEELNELRQALNSQDTLGIREEMGDILSTCVNLARHLGMDAEESLRSSSGKFQRRFERMEIIASAEGVSLSELSEEQMDTLWDRVKQEKVADN